MVFGRKRAIGKRLPDRVREYTGWLPLRDAPESLADEHLTVIENAPAPRSGADIEPSDYQAAFRQGAILVPRMLCLIDRKKLGRLGPSLDFPAIESRRSSQEKEPWRSLTSISGQIEERFIRPILLGESILPYRIFQVFEGAIPFDEEYGMLSAGKSRALSADPKVKSSFSAIEGWLNAAEKVWEAHRSAATRLTFAEQLDYYGKLSAQYPIALLRVVYAKAGTLPAACIIRDERAVIDHMLYWAKPATEEEAHLSHRDAQ